MGLKTFIVTEALRLDQAERFLRYKEKYHTEVFLDLKERLTLAWERSLRSLEKKYPPPTEKVQDAQLRYPQATVQLTLVNKTEKIASARSRDPLIVAPSVKVPLVYDHHERDRVIAQLLSDAEEVFSETADAWSEIFTVEKDGRNTPWFRINRDHDETRFQLTLTINSHENYKTLYAIRVEYGRPGSRSKDFDRAYLISLI